jgi:hypothetical protein
MSTRVDDMLQAGMEASQSPLDATPYTALMTVCTSKVKLYPYRGAASYQQNS